MALSGPDILSDQVRETRALTAPTTNQPDIAVIVVNYGTPDLAVRAVNSVLDHDNDGRVAELHLIDNASPDDSAARFGEAMKAPRWASAVTLHLESENHGFGRANNLVLRDLADREVPPRYVFLLNPDAELDNEAIAILAGFLDDQPRTAATGVRLRFADSELRTACFRFPTIASEFAGTANIGPLTRMLSRYRVPLAADLTTSEVDWVTGSAVMFRFEALSECGFFDPDFFLYHEEMELMWRLRKRGWEIWHVSEAVVIHAEGAATGIRSSNPQPSRRPAYWYDSRRLYLLKTGSRLRAASFAIAQYAGAALSWLATRLRGGPARLPEKFFSDYWQMVMRPILLGSR